MAVHLRLVLAQVRAVVTLVLALWRHLLAGQLVPVDPDLLLPPLPLGLPVVRQIPTTRGKGDRGRVQRGDVNDGRPGGRGEDLGASGRHAVHPAEMHVEVKLVLVFAVTAGTLETLLHRVDQQVAPQVARPLGQVGAVRTLEVLCGDGSARFRYAQV